jgi:hypothetical protein
MSKNSLAAILIFACLIRMATSCSKSSEYTTIADRLEGKWKLTKYATDNNLNGRIDNYEIHDDTSIHDYQYVFNKDGSGLNTSVFNGVKSPDLKFYWSMISYDSMRIAYVANDTLVYHVSDITSKQMTLTSTSKLENTNTKEITWLFFVKI